MLLWPRHGARARWKRAHALGERTLVEDFLKHIHAHYLRGSLATHDSLAGAFALSMSDTVDRVTQMEARGLVRVTGPGLELTPVGNSMALQVIRAHRLLERYFADELRMPLKSIHAAADRQEHKITPTELEELEARLGYPRRDPHGDPIPTATGALFEDESSALIDWEVGRPAKIVHIEDEPPEVFSQIVEVGLRPGMHIEIIDVTDSQLSIWDGAIECLLSPVAAANVSVTEVPEPVVPPLRLSTLQPGETGVVLDLECEGLTRRRLLDLGLTPGTRVKYEFRSSFGEPSAYRIRGALIALRPDQTDQIVIEWPDRQDEGGTP
jgi:DtxR family Mn-dependent transcriptional regulator